METEKICKTCKYFYQHYVLSGYRYRPLFCGHCAHKNAKKLFNQRRLDGCAEWEQDDRRKEKTMTIKYALLETARTVRNIANIFENEEELYGRTSLLPVQRETQTLTTQVSDRACGEKDSAGNSSAE